MNEAIAQCLRGEISPQVALSRMLLGGADAAAIVAAVNGAPRDDPQWPALAALLAGREAELDKLAVEIGQTGSNHASLGSVDGIAAFFDRAVAHSPEAGVALYSLGDKALLETATAEIVAWLEAERVVAADAAVLDLGCGMGRVATALAPHCRSVLGVDVSHGMIAEARRRTAGDPKLRFTVTDGRMIPPGPFDLVLAVDSMPYIVQAGLADSVVRAIAGALHPEGVLVVLNLSYGRQDVEDRADAMRWATNHGWSMAFSRPFSLWDASAFVFR